MLLETTLGDDRFDYRRARAQIERPSSGATAVQELHLESVAKKWGDVPIRGIMRQIGVIKKRQGKSALDVVGFDYMVHRSEESCFQYYAANPPLTGITEPVTVKRPFGLEVFSDYVVDYRQAIEIFHRREVGEVFTHLALFKPLANLRFDEPLWFVRAERDVTVVIGANSATVYR